ncbi:hypothetical protein U1872_03755 [Sphingomonas sp. RB3P16]|uniref:hypothetical protein n=1 Tax=Parasphingomonas frigoris TaxID=3096163 RepID=UPI002FC7EB75
MVTPVQQSAVNDIRAKLDSSGVFNTVTHDEVNDIAARLKGLSATDTDAVIDELSRTGQLDTLAREGTDGSWFGNGGWSASERKDVFNDLAAKLDGTSLARVSNALASTDANGADGHARVGEFASAIASHASAAAKVDYIRAEASRTTDSTGYSSAGFGGSVSHDSDAEAAGVATVLGSLRGAQAEAGFRALDPAQTRAVMRAGVDATLNSTASSAGSANSLSWDTAGLRGVLGAASSIGNADLKARLFDAGVDTMRSVRDSNSVFGGLTVVGKDAALSEITSGLTKLIDSDTSGVVRELAYNQETADGSDLAAYAKQLLNSGQTDTLGRQMARLQLGNGLNENAVGRLDVVTTVPGSNGQERRENAGALGYFVGSTYSATASISKDVKAQQEMVTAVLKSALTVVDKAKVGGPAALAVGTTASVAKEWVQFAVRAAIQDPGSSAATQLERAALPTNPATAELGVGDDIANAFNTTLSRVQRLANP